MYDRWNSSVFRCDLKVISDDDERMLCNRLFHADVAEAAKARLPSVARGTAG